MKTSQNIALRSAQPALKSDATLDAILEALITAHAALRVTVPGSEDGYSGERRRKARSAIESVVRYPGDAEEVATQLEQHGAAFERSIDSERLAVLVDVVRIVGKRSHWDAAGWTLTVPESIAHLLFDVAYGHSAKPRWNIDDECRALCERNNALLAEAAR